MDGRRVRLGERPATTGIRQLERGTGSRIGGLRRGGASRKQTLTDTGLTVATRVSRDSVPQSQHLASLRRARGGQRRRVRSESLSHASMTGDSGAHFHALRRLRRCAPSGAPPTQRRTRVTSRRRRQDLRADKICVNACDSDHRPNTSYMRARFVREHAVPCARVVA